ncbi:MAG: exodeoxyribonuclease VII small subunit [Phycisphaerales bacterium]|nr:exodeoxyribonuclease VII small subunit [Phycisphaerales bacterium]
MSKRKNAASEPSAAETLNYEQAVTELEQIIDQMESGETPLEQALADYERGVALLKRCRSIISWAEQKIEHLKAIADETAASAAETVDQECQDEDEPNR